VNLRPRETGRDVVSSVERGTWSYRGLYSSGLLEPLDPLIKQVLKPDVSALVGPVPAVNYPGITRY